MVFRQNTVARHTRYVFDLLLDPGSGSMLIDANVIAEGFVGVGNDAVRPGVQYTCDLPWDNVQNWPFDSDLTGIDGNISVSPWFCDSANDNFHVAGNSPCLPAHNSCGVQLGAFGLGLRPDQRRAGDVGGDQEPVQVGTLGVCRLLIAGGLDRSMIGVFGRANAD